MKRKYRFLLTLSSAALLTPIIAVSCVSKADENIIRTNNYDFGLATQPLNNLNYVKYKSLDRVLPSLVDSYSYVGLTDEMRTLLPTSKLIGNIVRFPETFSNDLISILNDSENQETALSNKGLGFTTYNYQEISEYNYIGGLIRPSGDDVVSQASFYLFASPKNPNNYMALTGLVNKQTNEWSNGDIISATDLQDYFHYVLDYNTGSQKLEEIIKLNIRGANDFLDAQREYALKFNKNYQNPFGRRKYIKAPWDEKIYIQNPDQKVWESQSSDLDGKPIDLAEVEKIKNAALKIGFYTSRLFLDFTNEEIYKNLELPENKNFDIKKDVQDFYIIRDNKTIKIQLVKNIYVNPVQVFDEKLMGKIKTLGEDEDAYTMILDENGSVGLLGILNYIFPKLYPVNRKYIETVGEGIQKYGTDASKFLTSSAFNIENINLGPQGFIDLVKNDNYFTASNTISNRIKIYFQTDPIISATWFEDGYIHHSFVPAIRINSFFSDLRFRPLLKKNSGFGTIGFGFNLDYEKRANSPLQDPDLRKAIYYAINREDILKTVGWDFSFPVNTWNAFGNHKSDTGKSIELYFDHQKTSSEDGKTFDLQNFSHLNHLAKNFEFEKTERRDKLYSPDTAQFYIERFKKNNPDLKQVTISFLNNSTEEQIKAGIYLEHALKSVFGDYIDLRIKGLPENAYASIIEKGDYDMIYQNYDKLGGSQVYDYVGVFFEPDEIDSYASRNIGYKRNPVGSFTYSDWLSKLYETKKGLNRTQIIDPYLNYVLSLNGFNQDLSELAKNNFLSGDRVKLVSKYSKIILENVAADTTNLGVFMHKNLFTNEFVSNLIEYAVTPNENIRFSRLNRIFKLYLLATTQIKDIQEATADTGDRLFIPRLYWDKIIELSFRGLSETSTRYTSRISKFFTENFSQEDLKNLWDTEKIYLLIGYFEKIIREIAPVIPLIEVDTNWQISTIGGTKSLFTYVLQYAYDVKKPPRVGLPRKLDK